MKFQVESTKEATVEIFDEYLFNQHLSGDLKEHFWDYEDSPMEAIENIIHQFYWEGDGEARKIGDEFYRVKMLEGWGEFIRHFHSTDEWVNDNVSQSYIGKIVVKTDSEYNHYTQEL